jgi:hypothetical protein
MQDPRDSKGNFSPKRDPGPPAKSGDGIATEMIRLRSELYSVINAAVFTSQERKEAHAEAQPGGRQLISSEADKDFLKSIVEKYTKLLRERDGTKELDEGFAANMAKGD